TAATRGCGSRARSPSRPRRWRGSRAGTAAVQQLRVRQWPEASHARPRLLPESPARGEGARAIQRGRDAHGATLTFKPVEVAAFAEDMVFSHAERVLFMSATILDVGTFLRSLGVAEDDAAVVRVPSTFPPSRRPLVLRPSARLTRRH